MRRIGLAASIWILGLTYAGGAAADKISASAQIQAGYADGRGVGGAQRDDAFSEGAAGPAYGARAGIEILFARAWIEHNQLVSASGLQGTWTQFMAGLGVDFGLGDERKGMTQGDGGVPKGGYHAYYGEIGIGLGLGVGTGQQVEPPLSNRQVTDRGFMGRLSLGGGYRLTEELSIGLELPIEAGYLFKSGDDAFANEDDTHYQSVRAAALLNFRARLGF